MYNRAEWLKWAALKTLKTLGIAIVLVILIPTGWISEWSAQLYVKLKNWHPKYPKYTSKTINTHNKNLYEVDS